MEVVKDVQDPQTEFKGEPERIAHFDPNKDYVWKPTDRFKLKGRELEIMHNTLGAIFSGQVPEPQMYLMLNEMLKITTGIIRENVELGIIQEKSE